MPPSVRRTSYAALYGASIDARIVDGPTTADAYMLHVPKAGLAGALTTLRARADVVLAEPVDAALVELGGNDGLRGLPLDATLVMFVSGIVLGWLGAWWTVSRHLRQIEPQ